MKFNIINNHVLVPFIFKGKITLTSDACWGEYTSVCYKVWKTAIHCMSSFQSQNESFMPAATAAYLQSQFLVYISTCFLGPAKTPSASHCCLSVPIPPKILDLQSDLEWGGSLSRRGGGTPGTQSRTLQLPPWDNSIIHYRQPQVPWVLKNFTVYLGEGKKKKKSPLKGPYITITR